MLLGTLSLLLLLRNSDCFILYFAMPGVTLLEVWRLPHLYSDLHKEERGGRTHANNLRLKPRNGHLALVQPKAIDLWLNPVKHTWRQDILENSLS